MLGPKARLEGEPWRTLVERRDCGRIAKHVMYPPERVWARIDGQRGRDDPQVVAVSRPAHEPVFAEIDWLVVQIRRLVANIENCHVG
jgi:hypothetical protein